jgi:hypothetical protein
MIINPAILDAIEAHAPGLACPDTINARALLAAITYPETDWGRRYKAALFEQAYYRGGKFYRDHVKTLVAEYESLASCSWGAWQILFVAARETGYQGDPWGLVDPATCCAAVVTLLNKRCFNNWVSATDPALVGPASTPAQCFDFWNSGSWRDRFIPGDYVATGLEGYQEALDFYSGVARVAVTP